MSEKAQIRFGDIYPSLGNRDNNTPIGTLINLDNGTPELITDRVVTQYNTEKVFLPTKGWHKVLPNEKVYLDEEYKKVKEKG